MPGLVLILFFRKARKENAEMVRSDRLERLVPESFPPEQVGSEGAEPNLAELARAVPTGNPARGRGDPKNVDKSISSFKILRPDEVWHPRVGARPGNKNALKHGHYTAERKAHRKKLAVIDAFIREVLRKARRIEFQANDALRNRASSNPP